MNPDESDSKDDLVEAVKDALARRGVISSIKAKLRSEIFLALEEKDIPAPKKPDEVFLADEIIRDYLSSMKLENSSSVFCEESGQTRAEPVNRQLLCSQFGFKVERSMDDLPVLILLINHLLEVKRERDITLSSGSI